VQQRPNAVDRRRRIAREQLQRDERRAAARRALVVEPAPQQFDLLLEAELPDRTVGDRPLPEVAAAREPLDLVCPLRAQLGELLLGAALGERLCLRRCLLEVQTELNER
jgi:hypothetical protein